ncbi:hypothetical protein V1504DRAFT_490978 [Lipomyces starkeyi]
MQRKSIKVTEMVPAPLRCQTRFLPIGDNEQVSCQRALKFLTANEPGKRLEIRLSYKSLLALEEQVLALYGDAKYMSNNVEYSATDSRVTVYTAPTALHCYSAVNLQQAIIFAVYNVLVQHQRQDLFERIAAVGESTYSSEVGVSEWYPQLNADIMLWMNEFRCRTAILLYNKIPFGPYHDREQSGSEPWTNILEVFKQIRTDIFQNGRIVVQGSSLDIGLTAIRDIRDELVHLGINFVAI